MNTQNATVIIVAAGSGRRLGLAKPKAFVRLCGRPMVEHSLARFSKVPAVKHLVLVAPPGLKSAGALLRKRYRKLAGVVPGGAERADSVRAGLAAVPARSGLVLVHDAARPLVLPRDIAAVIRAAGRHGAAVLAEPMVDTVKRVDRGFVRATLNRSMLWRAQTPQAFRRELIERAYARPARHATDDSSLAEALGTRVWVVPASGPNFKITTRAELEMASCLLGKG